MKPKVEGFVFEDTEHHSDTLERLNSLRKNGRFCDVVLQLGKHEMKAHRAVLASASAYLMDLFARMDTDESWDGRVKLNSLTIPEFQILLDYIYTGRLEVPSDGNVKAVYRMSRKLKLARPAEACVEYMTKNLDADNCVGTRACGSGHSDSALTNVCDEYIGQNVQAVASSKDCLSLPRIQVEIVGTDDITINDSNEEGLFNLVLRWIREKIEADETDDGLIADHVHVLYLSADNVLLDCKDLDVDMKLQNTEYIKDYKKLHKLRQTGVRGKKEGKSPANGDSVPKARKLTFAPIENPVTETEWKIIVSERTADHQYMCICVLNAKLATVSIHLRQRPSSANSNSNGESSENGGVSPRTIREPIRERRHTAMTGCSAFNCCNRSENGFLMKSFPRDQIRRAQWEAKVRRVGWHATNSSFLCDVHFDEAQWEKTRVDGTRKLKCNAVPTIFSFTKPSAPRQPPRKRELPLPPTENSSAEVRDEPDESQEVGAELVDCGGDACVSTADQCTDGSDCANNLRAKVEKQNKHINVLSRQVNSLRKKISANRIEKCRTKKRDHNFNSKIKKIFNDDQLLSISRKSMRFQKWSNKTVSTALGLRFTCGSNGYQNLLNLNLPYPSIRTLQRRLQSLEFKSGILFEVIEFLKCKVGHMSDQERHCVLVLDETDLISSIDYDISTNLYLGEVTLPHHSGIATHASVLMLGGISRWKQTIAYYFTPDSVDGSVIKDIVVEVVRAVASIGLTVDAVISDMGGSNQAMWKAFGIVSGRHSRTVCSIPNPVDPHKHIEILPDPVHVFKNIRMSLLKNTFRVSDEIREKYKLKSNTILSQHIKDLVEFQEDFDLKFAHKLTPDLLDENHFDKMKVSRARHVLNHDVSTGMTFMADQKQNDEYLTTAWFIELVSKWFELMTSRHPALAISKKCSINYEKTIQFLKDVIEVFEHLDVTTKSGRTSWKPIQTGLILATSSILKLQEKLLSENSFDFLLTSRFTQDCLENLFSVLRMKQVVPTAFQFRNNLKLVCVSQYLKCVSKETSYDEDDRQFLDGFLDQIAENKTKKKTFADRVEFDNDDCISHDTALNNPEPSTISMSEQNVLYHISGYILTRVKKLDKTCVKCFSTVGSKKCFGAEFTKYVSLKEYKDDCLFYASSRTFQFFLEMEKVFRLLQSRLLSQNKNCRDFVLKAMVDNSAIKNADFKKCCAIKRKIMKRFAVFRLKIFGLKQKRLIKQTSVSLSSKSTAMRMLSAKCKK